MSSVFHDVQQVMNAQGAPAPHISANYGSLEGEYATASTLHGPYAGKTAAEGVYPGPAGPIVDTERSGAMTGGMGSLTQLNPNEFGISEHPADGHQQSFQGQQQEGFYTPPRTTRYGFSSMATWASGVERAQSGLSWMARLGEFMRARMRFFQAPFKVYLWVK